MEHFILECTLERPFSKDDEKRNSQAIETHLGEHGGRWIRTYYNRERTRLICEFEAPDAETVSKAWEQARCPLDAVWPAVVYERETFLQPQG